MEPQRWSPAHMEPQLFPSFPVLLTLVSFLFLLLKARSWKPQVSDRLPPGPRKLPLIGNIHQVGSLPHHGLRDLANKHGPIMHLTLGELSVIVISSPETAKQVMRVHDINFAHRPYSLPADVLLYNFNDVAFAPYGPYWRQLRKICTVELLSAKRVHLFGALRHEEVMNLAKTVASSNGSPLNLSELLFSSAYQTISRAAIGTKGKYEEKFKQVTRKISEKTGGFSIVDVFPSAKWLQLISGRRAELEKIHEEADEILENIIGEHKAEKRNSAGQEEDLVDVLLNLQDHGDLEFPLTTTHIKGVILDCLLGGTETSSTTIEWAMSEMLKSPSVMEKAQAEIRQTFGTRGGIDEAKIQELKYLKAVIQETLRLHPPLPLLIPRASSERCEINGYEIPAKSQVLVNAWAIGRDPQHWNDSDKFIPERFLGSSIEFKGTDFEFIPFGAGRRICPGMSFGVANIELPLVVLLFHFDWKLPYGKTAQDLDMTEAFGAAVRRKFDLSVIPIVHSSLSVS